MRGDNHRSDHATAARQLAGLNRTAALAPRLLIGLRSIHVNRIGRPTALSEPEPGTPDSQSGCGVTVRKRELPVWGLPATVEEYEQPSRGAGRMLEARHEEEAAPPLRETASL